MCIRGCKLLVIVAAIAASAGCNLNTFRVRTGGPAGPVADPRGHATSGGTDLKIVEMREVDLVEQVATHRAAYHQSLATLREYYEQKGDSTKLAWAEFEQKGLRRVKPFQYLLDAEIPSEHLSATNDIPEANARFERAMELLKKGGYNVPALYSQDTMVEAANEFRSLIIAFPSSDKIDDAAFYLGEIHRMYFKDQQIIAARWYERALSWNPETQLPARIEAARLYDFKLHDRLRAVEHYRIVADDATADASDRRFASRRIEELSGTGRMSSAR